MQILIIQAKDLPVLRWDFDVNQAWYQIYL